MRIAFYAPFKPMDHPRPSGDQIIARGLFDSLQQQGHDVEVASRRRCRWIYWNPSQWLQAYTETHAIINHLKKHPVDCWLTYHSYYKSPDIIGPAVTSALHLPYIIIQPSYATKFSRNWQTCCGYLLNTRALRQACLLITDRKHDLIELQRIASKERLASFRPGINPQEFSFDNVAREELRSEWHSGDRPVILTAAMFRADVKSKGIARVITSCIHLYQQGHDFQLVIAGDGVERQRLQQLAGKLPEAMVHFTGALSRKQMADFYSGGDLFVFPGFRESLGMVFLEAQSCGLPVVACDNGGIPEVVHHGKSGLLAEVDDEVLFCSYIRQLLLDKQLRRTMGQYAAQLIRTHHDRRRNHHDIGKMLEAIVQNRQ